MKRIYTVLLCMAMAVSMFGCAANKTTTDDSSNGTETTITAPAENVAMQYITPEEASALLEDENYVFFDVRKAADYATAHVPGALGYDMDAAKEGDFDAGVATMQKAVEGVDENIILVCYSGKRHAQAATNVLSAMGHDMSKVYTLEGGFTAWSETYPENVTAE